MTAKVSELATGLIKANAMGVLEGLAAFPPGYADTAGRLLKELGAAHADPKSLPLVHASNSRAYDALMDAAPDVAVAIDRAADSLSTPFWSRNAVRYSLAWLVASLIITAYIAGTVLFPPWGLAVVAALTGAEITAPRAYRSVLDATKPPSVD